MQPTRYSQRNSLERIEWKLDHLHEMIHGLKEGQQAMATNFAAEIENLTTQVTEMDTVAKGSAALLRKISQMMRDNAADPAAIRALADKLNSTEEELAAAVAENTPAAEEPPVEPAPEEPPVE